MRMRPCRSFILALLLLSSVQVSAQSWKLVWSDEFNWNGGVDPNNWGHDSGAGGWGNGELQNYTNRWENCRVEDNGGTGRLIIEARRDYHQGIEYSSCRLVGRKSFTYGRFEIRAKIPGGRGTWPAIWMLPTQWTYGNGGWPDNGEMDIMEHVGFDPDTIHSTLHSRDRNFKVGNQITASRKVPGAMNEYHTYTMEWGPDYIFSQVDGATYFVANRNGAGWTSWPFTKEFHFILNIAVGGNWGGAQGVDPNIWPRRMEIDWIRVYQYR